LNPEGRQYASNAVGQSYEWKRNLKVTELLTLERAHVMFG